ncbi:MAG: hypothetical protein ACK4LB_02425 [Spirosomataceae bacterium]
MLNFIIPHFNENITRFKNTCNVAIKVSKKLNLEYKLLIGDGGSKIQYINEILKFIETIEKDKLKFIFPLPVTRQNKNNIIKCLSNETNTGLVIILDSDIPNLNEKFLIRLIDEFKNKESSILIPQSNFQPGRSNKLIGGPILRVLFPSIYKIIKHPFPGIMLIDSRLLKKIVNHNYFIDWGGELSILINSSELDLANFHSINVNIKEEKHRELNSKKLDSYQIYRAAIYHFLNKENSIQSVKVKYNPKKHSRLLRKTQIKLRNDGLNYDDITIFINEKNLQELYDYLIGIYKRKNKVEYFLVASLVIVPLAKICCDLNINEFKIESNSLNDTNFDLNDLGIICDLILVKSINLLLEKNFITIKKEILDSISPMYSCVSSKNFNTINFNQNGINISDLNQNEIINIINSFSNSN